MRYLERRQVHYLVHYCNKTRQDNVPLGGIGCLFVLGRSHGFAVMRNGLQGNIVRHDAKDAVGSQGGEVCYL